jgi:hypothetical protein
MYLSRALYLALSLMAGCSSAIAQNANDFVNIFGGLIKSAIIQTTLTEWKKLPLNELACVDQNLRQQGSSLQAAIQQGMTPSDPRIVGTRAPCINQVAPQTKRPGPSFDCVKAKLPDERAICSDAELSQLDNLVVDGYNYVRSRYGVKVADAIGVPLWRARQACGSDVTCIKQKQLVSIDSYKAHGAPLTIPVSVVNNAVEKSIYVVDGLALGGSVFGSKTYGDYQCGPSEQFIGFTWCKKSGLETDPRGQYASSRSILHSADGTTIYINRYLEPAWFSSSEANDDINSRSKKYGAPTRIIPMPQQSSVPNGMIVTWGSVILEQLDPNNVSALAMGRDIHVGFIIDHIGNFQRSAQMGLPIYRLIGGPGYVWAASWNQVGVGTLRFLTIDPMAIGLKTLLASTKVEPSAGVHHNELSSNAQAQTDTEQQANANTRAEHQPRISDEALKRIAQEEVRSNIEYIRATSTRISDRLAIVRNSEKRQKVEEISARLATANAEMPPAEITSLRSEADLATLILDEYEEFGRVAEISDRRMAAINAELEKITSDAPVIQKIQAAIRSVKLARSGSDLHALQDALKSLNNSYDNNRNALQAMEFESP